MNSDFTSSIGKTWGKSRDSPWSSVQWYFDQNLRQLSSGKSTPRKWKIQKRFSAFESASRTVEPLLESAKSITKFLWKTHAEIQLFEIKKPWIVSKQFFTYFTLLTWKIAVNFKIKSEDHPSRSTSNEIWPYLWPWTYLLFRGYFKVKLISYCH